MKDEARAFLRRTALSAAAILLLAIAKPGIAAPLMMISVDGLKPEYVFEADQRGLKLPYLRSLLRNGTYADGVIGVWPTVTYPSHTTLVTGVSPAEHGIFANTEFDPEQHFKVAWFWYADQIRTPTLWQDMSHPIQDHRDPQSLRRAARLFGVDTSLRPESRVRSELLARGQISRAAAKVHMSVPGCDAQRSNRVQ